MKCCESPITSNAVKPEQRSPGSASAREESTMFATLLLGFALKPVSDAIGPLGSAVADEVAALVAKRQFEAPR